MNKEQFVKALDLVDSDIIDEFISEEDRLRRNVKKRRTLVKYVRGAACLCVLVIIFTAAINLYTPPSGDGNGNDSAIPPGMGTVTTEKEPQNGTMCPGTDLSYTFVYDGESYTVYANDKIPIKQDAVYLGIVMLTEDGQSAPTIESNVFSLSDGSLAVEIDGGYYKATKNSE